MKPWKKALLWLSSLLLLVAGAWFYMMLSDESVLPADDLKPLESAAGEAGKTHGTLVFTSRGTLKNMVALTSPGGALEALLRGDRPWDAALAQPLVEDAEEAERLLDEALVHPRWTLDAAGLRNFRAVRTALKAQAMVEIATGGGRAPDIAQKLLTAGVRAAAAEGPGTIVTAWGTFMFSAAPLIVSCMNAPGFSDADVARLQQMLESAQLPSDGLGPALRGHHWLVRGVLTASGKEREDIMEEVLGRTFGRPRFQFQPRASANLLAERARIVLPAAERALGGQTQELVQMLRSPDHVTDHDLQPDLKSAAAWLTPNAGGEYLAVKACAEWAELTARWLDIAAIRECLITVAACERFRRARGRDPISLEELVPEYLKTPLIDPWTGGPLEFRTTERLICSPGISRPSDAVPIHARHRFAGVRLKPLDEKFYIIFAALPPVAPPPALPPKKSAP